jgi:DNA/RNA endonuclease YhcR with UshA esterase domain
MRLLTSILGAVAALLTASLPAAAHHAFGAEFDANRPVLLKGKIVKMEWVNPHTWIHVEIVKDDGTKEVWMVEGGSPNTLLRRGANKNTFPVGTDVVVDGYQARDHSEKRANARNVTFPDGRKLFLGSTGTGAPNPDEFPDKVKTPNK